MTLIRFGFALFALTMLPFRGIAGTQSVQVMDENRTVYTSWPFLQDPRLEEVGFWTREYSIKYRGAEGVDESALGTQLYAWYKTKRTDDTLRFVFVQFIRGCVYSTYISDGVLTVRREDSRRFFDTFQEFKHGDWVVDSVDTDASYWSSRAGKLVRHDQLRMGGTDLEFPVRPGDVPSVGSGEPLQRRLFVTDVPKAASVRWNPFDRRMIADNVSLQFKTCLFKEEDVPTASAPDNVTFANPVVCYWWNNNHVYDHEQQVMTSPQKISPICKDDNVSESTGR